MPREADRSNPRGPTIDSYCMHDLHLHITSNISVNGLIGRPTRQSFSSSPDPPKHDPLAGCRRGARGGRPARARRCSREGSPIDGPEIFAHGAPCLQGAHRLCGFPPGRVLHAARLVCRARPCKARLEWPCGFPPKCRFMLIRPAPKALRRLDGLENSRNFWTASKFLSAPAGPRADVARVGLAER